MNEPLVRETAARYIAFLRAINVGGHTVKMDHLRALFEGFGFAAVETYIASGNVVFAAAPQPTSALETRIVQGLRAALGYEVATFIRTDVELARVAAHQPFAPAELVAAQALNIAFLAQPLAAPAIDKLLALKTAIDDFAVHEREVYWLCRKQQSASTFSNTLFEKRLGVQATFRSVNTVRKLAARCAAQLAPAALPTRSGV